MEHRASGWCSTMPLRPASWLFVLAAKWVWEPQAQTFWIPPPKTTPQQVFADKQHWVTWAQIFQITWFPQPLSPHKEVNFWVVSEYTETCFWGITCILACVSYQAGLRTSTDTLQIMNSTAFSLHRNISQAQSERIKHSRQCLSPSHVPLQVQNLGLCLLCPIHWYTQGTLTDLHTCCPHRHKLERHVNQVRTYVAQAIKLHTASSGFQYKKGSFASESSPDTYNQPFYKRFQLVLLNLNSARDQV
jgi:hypothetical protein